MKKTYMKPCAKVINTKAMTTYLIGASANGKSILDYGGTTNGSVTEAGGKIRGTRTSDDDFDDLW